MNTWVDIKVFPNKLDPSLMESCKCEFGITLHDWLTSNVPAYFESDEPLFTVIVNNKILMQENWKTYQLSQNDDVSIIVEPKDPATIAYAVIAIIAVGYAVYTANQIPDNYNSTTPDGSSIYDVNTQGNKPRLMGIIPEAAGRHLIYPIT